MRCSGRGSSLKAKHHVRKPIKLVLTSIYDISALLACVVVESEAKAVH
jgi:hypothetical protein